jgi:hypothetical protein
MKAILKSIWSYRLIRLALAGLFLAAAVIKMGNPAVFAVTIEAFGLAPKGLSMPVALALPVLELAAALGLILDVRGSLAAITGLTLLFIFVLSFGLWLGLDIDCGCYGPGDPEAEAFHGLRTALYRDLLMLTGCAFLYWWRQANRSGPVRLRELVREIIIER